jgi:hypothetical protein
VPGVEEGELVRVRGGDLTGARSLAEARA